MYNVALSFFPCVFIVVDREILSHHNVDRVSILFRNDILLCIDDGLAALQCDNIEHIHKKQRQ